MGEDDIHSLEWEEAGDARELVAGVDNGAAAAVDDFTVNDFNTINAAGDRMEAGFCDAQEYEGVVGEGAEAVAQFIFEGAEMSEAGGEADAAEEVEAQGGTVNIFRGEIAREGEAKFDGSVTWVEGGQLFAPINARGLRAVGGRLMSGTQRGVTALFEQFDSALEEPAIHAKADGGDMAGLLRAEEIAGAADFEIAHGDGVAGAESGVFEDGFEAVACGAVKDKIRGNDQIGVGLAGGTADAAAELVEIGETKSVRVVNNNGVDVGQIKA